MRALSSRVFAALFLLGTITGSATAADIYYSYDALGRLVQIVYPSGKTVTYTYDAAGNRTSVTVTP